ncbi:MAG: hypothetical protein ABIJ48_07425 [Actinomycetota bacterium]
MAVGADGSTTGEYDAAVWLSPDGLTWTRVPQQGSLGGPGLQVMEAVTAGGPGLVAVGEYNETLFDPHAAVWLSADGVTWTRVDPGVIEGEGAGPAPDLPPGSGEGAVMHDVTTFGSGLIAVGEADPYTLNAIPAIWVSANGLAWEQILLDPGVQGETSHSHADAVAAGPYGVAVAGRIGDRSLFDGTGRSAHGLGAVWMSEDGIDWRLAAAFEPGPMDEPADCRYQASTSAVAWSGETLLVGGELRTGCLTRNTYAAVWASTDAGETWHMIAKEPVEPAPSGGGRTWGPERLVSDIDTFGSQTIVVGGIGWSGVAWLGEWPDG